jgi:photosystem II stability/assembly factor-like uncharacterized protein
MLWKSFDGGETITQFYDAEIHNQHLIDIIYVKENDEDNNIGFIITDDGKCFKSIDSGLTWNEIVLDENITYALKGIVALNDNVIYIYGEGIVFKSIDNGTTFVIDTSMPNTMNINKIIFEEVNLAFAVGETVGAQNIYRYY